MRLQDRAAAASEAWSLRALSLIGARRRSPDVQIEGLQLIVDEVLLGCLECSVAIVYAAPTWVMLNKG